MRTKEDYTFVHWNMRDINYGFIAIEHRFEVLGGKPYEFRDDKKFDIAAELISLYGRALALDMVRDGRIFKSFGI